jgi:hypothetical protein
MGKGMFVAVLLGVGIGGIGIAHAAPPTEKPAATKNSCWGQVTKAFAALGPGIIGTHTRASSSFTATPTPLGGTGDPPFDRKGVANQSRFLEDIGVTDAGEPGQGGNGEHALANAAGVPGLEDTLNCDGPPTP